MVEARNGQGALLSLPLFEISGGLAIEKIDGLDPVKATVVSSSYASLDGAQYQSSRREFRNLRIRLALEADYMWGEVREIRDRLYDYFMPKSKVDLRFIDTSGLIVDISGRVESFSSELFVKEPFADIVVLCFDPDFLVPTPTVLNGLTTPSTNQDIGGVSINYKGTVETGIQLVLNVNRSLSEFTIYHKTPEQIIKSFDFAAPLAVGDVVTINTVPGSKGVTLTRNGTNSSLLYARSPQSNWIELSRGSNYIRVYTEGVGIPYTVTYTTRYGAL
jgi:hypothetical protein